MLQMELITSETGSFIRPKHMHKIPVTVGSKIMAIPTEPAKAAGKGKTAPVTER